MLIRCPSTQQWHLSWWQHYGDKGREERNCPPYPICQWLRIIVLQTASKAYGTLTLLLFFIPGALRLGGTPGDFPAGPSQISSESRREFKCCECRIHFSCFCDKQIALKVRAYYFLVSYYKLFLYEKML